MWLGATEASGKHTVLPRGAAPQVGQRTASIFFGLISAFIGRSCSKHPVRMVNFAKRGGTRPYRVIVHNLGGSLDSGLGLPALKSA
jgi:hypothetical protein